MTASDIQYQRPSANAVKIEVVCVKWVTISHKKTMAKIQITNLLNEVLDFVIIKTAFNICIFVLNL